MKKILLSLAMVLTCLSAMAEMKETVLTDLAKVVADGVSFSIKVGDKYVYGTNNQNTGYGTYEESVAETNSVTSWKAIQNEDGSYSFVAYRPDGTNYGIWGANPAYLNAQPSTTGVSFILGKDQDLTGGASWVFENGALKNVGNGAYLAGTVTSESPVNCRLVTMTEVVIPRYAAVPATAKVENPWDNQAWFVLGDFAEGDTFEFSATVKATKAASVGTQIHKEPGNYIHWAAIGNVEFTTEWKNISATGTFAKAGSSIALNLNDFEEANTYYFDNLSLKVNGVERIKNGTFDGNNMSSLVMKLDRGAIVEANIITEFEKAEAPTLAEGQYYFINLENNLFLEGNNSWGTQASTGDACTLFNVTKLANGNYSIANLLLTCAEKELGENLYIDSTTPEAGWQISYGNSIYSTIYLEGKGYVAASQTVGENNYPIVEYVQDVTDAAKWIVISKEAFQQALTAKDVAVNMTSYISNPDFSRNLSQEAWVATEETANKNLGDGAYSNFNAESWRSAFDISQTLTGLPAGAYMLTAQASCVEYEKTGVDLPVVYANDKTSLFNISSQATTQENGENSMSEMSASFAKGLYSIEPIFVEITDGTLKIGVKGTRTDTWCIWDHFRLTKIPEVDEKEPSSSIVVPEGFIAVSNIDKAVGAKVILVNAATGDILYGPNAQNTGVGNLATVSDPSNAVVAFIVEKADNGYLFRDVTPAGGDYSLWGANPCYLNSQPNVGGVSFNLGKDKDCANGSTWNLVWNAEKSAFAIQSVANNGYLAGTTIEAEPTYWVVAMEAPYNVGDDIKSLAPASWEGEGGKVADWAWNGHEGASEFYNGSGSVAAGDVMTQTITDLLNGTYEVTMTLAASYTSGRGFECPTGDDLCVAFANDKQEVLPVVDRVSVAGDGANVFTFKVAVTDGTLKYGIKNLAPAGNWYLAQLDSIKFISTSVAANTMSAVVTDIDEIEVAPKANGKMIENGKIVIVKNGVKYNVNGIRVK